jgi:hypothetical protein
MPIIATRLLIVAAEAAVATAAAWITQQILDDASEA